MSLEKEKAKIKREIRTSEKYNFSLLSYFFSLFSANLNKFLPNIDRSQYSELFYETIYYQHCSALEQNSSKYLDASKIINSSNFSISPDKIKDNVIFATFHLGSYRSVISYLYNQGLKIALIIDDNVFKNQLESFYDTVENVLEKGKGSDLIILNVKERTSLIKLKHLMNEGYVMAVYLDGNTGINNTTQDFGKGHTLINFLDQEIHIRYGVGKLAALFNATIIPVISYREDGENNVIEFFEEIQQKDFSNVDDFTIKSVEKCYSLLETKLKKYPTQWECWGYIHNWFDRNKTIPYKKIPEKASKFNDYRYYPFFVNGSYFLFDILSYQTFPITKQLKENLLSLQFKKIDQELLLELKEKNIII